jgi:hypothetical protein
MYFKSENEFIEEEKKNGLVSWHCSVDWSKNPSTDDIAKSAVAMHKAYLNGKLTKINDPDA